MNTSRRSFLKGALAVAVGLITGLPDLSRTALLNGEMFFHVPVIVSDTVPDGHIYFLDMSAIEYLVHPDLRYSFRVKPGAERRFAVVKGIA